MRRHRLLTLLVLVFGMLTLAGGPAEGLQNAKKGKFKTSKTAEAPTPANDAEALRQAGLPADDADKLIEYLEQRTLTDVDQTKLKDVIRNLGAERFDVRHKASETLDLYGPAALGPLRDAERNPDPEIAFRAKEAVKKLNKVNHEAVAAAAVRAVLRLRSPKATKVLLGFLPLAGDDQVAEEIRAALVDLAVQNGKTDPAMLAALKDSHPLRRSAAAMALIEAKAEDAKAQVAEAIHAETDPEARFLGLWALTLKAREKDSLADLIKLTPRLSRGRIWQLEDLLLQLAGPDRPKAQFGRTPESMDRARDAWLAWWRSAGNKIDLAAFEYKPRILGFTDLVEMDPRGYGSWRVTTLGPDEKERWQITNLANPSDARMLPNGRFVISEFNNNQVTERDTSGKQIQRWGVSQPLMVEPLPNGGFLIASRNDIQEFDKESKPVFRYSRPGGQHDIVAGRRQPNGETVFVTTTGTGKENVHRLNAKGQPAGKSIELGRTNAMYAGLDVLSNDRILLAEATRVAEYDLKTGKAGWSYNIANPSSVQRLPNGNTLIAASQSNKLIEVDETGEIVWQYEIKDKLLSVLRAYRR